MQQKYVLKDRCILWFGLLILSIGTYSVFANTNRNDLLTVTAFQNRVKGIVTDTNGVPIPGVTVKIKGTLTGTFTNDKGVFLISASPTDVLQLTYIGFKPLEVSVGSSDELSITLKEDITNLDAVTVNAGYYTVKERERTGSIAKVTSEEIELQPIVSPLEALQGRMAGVEVIQRSGIPGNAPIIQIRGQNSLRNGLEDNGNLPLYIIDGVPINSSPVPVDGLLVNGLDPLSTLNLSSIESIEVLKDADATAIYGSRGANGVVLITTKKGYFNQKTEIRASWFSGLSEMGRRMKLMNTQQYISLRNATIANAGQIPDKEYDWDLTSWDTNRYTDWQNEILGGSTLTSKIDLSATGGNSSTNFRINGSYSTQGSILDADISYKKITTGVSLNHISENKKLNIQLNTNYGTEHSDLFDINNLLVSAYTLPPNGPSIYNDDGTLHWEEWVIAQIPNPMANKYSLTKGISRNLISNLGFSYELFSGLNLKMNLGYTLYNRESKTKTYNDVVAPERRPDTPHKATQHITNRYSWIIEPQLNYHKTIGHHQFDGLIGATFQQNENEDFGVRAEGFTTRALVGYLPAAHTLISRNNRHIRYKYNAIFGRLGYQIQSKYYLNFTGRRDGSSRFGPDKRFANFWAIGGAWVFSEENFIKEKFPFLSFGKLRGSYGVTGSDQIGDYNYLDSYEPTAGPNGLYPTQLFNGDFAWEENKKMELAIELGFLNDKFNLNLSWYRNRSSNQLLQFPLPAMSGFSSVQANLPATVENSGWEIEIFAFPFHSGELKWQTTFNLSIPRNRLVAFPDIDQTSYANKYKVGDPLNILMSYHSTGVDPQTGYYTVEDVNGDGNYDYNDRKVIQHMGRKYFGGFTNTLSYQGFSLSFLWDFVKQNGLKPYTFRIGQPGDRYNRLLEDFYKWQDGELNMDTSPEFSRSYSRWTQSEHGVVDASFIRLKTLSLFYDIPIQILPNIGIKGCRIYFNAQNLFTISSYQGVNLDSPGQSSTLFPVLRTFNTGFQISL